MKKVIPMLNKSLWERYKKYLCVSPSIGMMLDISRMDFPAKYIDTMEPEMQKAYRAMDELEAGAVANPDEQRMVGHYWLRSPERAPSAEIRKEIETTIHAVKDFASAVHGGTIRPEKRPRFTRLLIIGVGGSALGPQFIADALGTPADKMKPCFLDNTDPNGFDRLFTELGDDLAGFTACLTGPATETPPNCGCADMNNDRHADLADFVEFQQVFTARVHVLGF